MKILISGCILFATISLVLTNRLTDEEKAEIIEDCYPNLTSILIYGENLDEIAKVFNKLERVNLVLHQKTNSEDLSHLINFYRRFESLIIIQNSTNDITWVQNYKITSVMKIKMILIFETSDNCNHQNSFNIAWTLGTSSAFHICIFSETHQEVITYNPINNYAPASWTFKSKQILKNYSPAAIFYKNYSRENFCERFEFDRTKILSGHTIKAHTIMWNSWFSNPSVSRYLIINSDNVDAHYRGEPFQHLFVTSFIKTFNLSINMSFITFPNYKYPPEHYIELVSESVDISLEMLSQYGGGLGQWTHLELAYPLLISKDIIVTHKRQVSSAVEKIFNYYGWVTVISASIILSITFGVVYKAERKRLSFAFFECLRLITNTHLFTRMTSFKIRIFFSVVFLYFLIIQATFSGHLTAFLTKPEFRKNVEAIDDLSDPRYTQIYARHGTEPYFTNKPFMDKVIFQFDNCYELMRNKSVACVDDFIRLIIPIAVDNLHYSEIMSHNIWSFPLRKNWILKDHANKILMRLDQAGVLLKKWIDYHGILYSEIKKQDKSLELADYYRTIILNDLLFIFVFLILGLVISLSIFMIELFIHQKKQKDMKMRSILISAGFLNVKCRNILNQVQLDHN